MTKIDSSINRAADQPDLNAIFNALPAACMVISPDFTIAAVSDAHLRSTGATREQIVGRNIFDAFPGNPDDPSVDGVANIRASITRVLEHEIPDELPIQRYDVPIDGQADSGFAVRYWKPIHAPVFNSNGDVIYVTQYVENVTQQVIDSENVAKLKSEVSSQAQQLRDQQGIADLFRQAPAFMAMLVGAEHRVEFVNESYLTLIGHRNIIGRPLAEGLPDVAAQGFVTILDEVYRSGQPYAANAVKYAMQVVPDGPVNERHVDFVFQPFRNSQGAVTGIVIQGIDVTDRILTDARNDILIRLSDVFRDSSSPQDVIFGASALLGETLGVSRVGYGTIDPDAETITVERDWNGPGVQTLAGTLSLRDYGSFIDDMKLGKFIAIDDVEADHRTREAATALKRRSVGSFVNFPVIERGKLVAAIFINHAQARNWSKEELELIRDVAERTRTASERMRTESAMRVSEAKFRTIADAMPQIVWSTMPNGQTDYFNQKWYEFTGEPWSPASGTEWNALHPDDRERAWSVWQHSASTGETYEVQYRLRHHSGQYKWILARALPLRDDSGVILRWMGTCTDIDTQKNVEDEWKHASQRKDEFLAMLAHELRNPLAPISTAAQLLKMQGADERRIHRASDIITRQVKHMTDLVDDLLDVSRVTRGLVQLEKEDLDLRTIINGAVEQSRPLLEARQHGLVLHIPSAQAYINGDKTRLVQAIANLLNNAAKYTPQRGEIALLIDVQKTQVKISVTDNGVGMASELIPYVFELFTQAERTPDRAQGGLGLGLALVKSIATLHGGAVLAASPGAGKGSTFTIILPLVKPEKTKVVAAPTEKIANVAKPVRIMLVDDNQDAALSLSALLEAAGHHVLVFEDARSALDVVDEQDIQVFVLDIGLPDIDGFELARRLRANPKTENKVLIALTGYGQAHDRVLSKTAGFDYHFVKPIDTMQLTQILANVPKN
ncbi:PAS domain-containing protein [Noviherbaspirillum sp.]|uniref:PAS domain-containing protein n=1 Tax=Noviherbaspirillum sp. TaxID=1926288 RepID=UPI002FE3D05D